MTGSFPISNALVTPSSAWDREDIFASKRFKTGARDRDEPHSPLLRLLSPSSPLRFTLQPFQRRAHRRSTPACKNYFNCELAL